MPRNLFSHAILFLLVVLLMSLAGCGSPTPAAPQPTTQGPAQTTAQPTAEQPTEQSLASTKIDACALLTKTDAEQILGKPVDDPTHPVQGNETFSVDSCEYKVTGGTARDNATLIVTVPSNNDLAIAMTAYTTGMQQAQAAYNAAPVDVPGLGDRAYWVGGAGNNLSILKGIVNVTLAVSTQTGDSPSQALLDLAKVVLGRLP